MSTAERAATAVLRTAFRLARAAGRRLPGLRGLRPKTRRRLLRRTLTPVAALLARGGRPVEVDGLRLYLPQALVPTYLLQDYGARMRRVLDDLLQPGMVMADVGANIGFMALQAGRRVGPGGRVVAVEPGPDNLQFLYRNVEANAMPWIEVAACAAGAEAGTLPLHLGAIGTTHSLHAAEPGGETVEVAVAPLDELINGRLDLVKIDAEGHEIDVLDGMGRLLATNPDLRLIVEWSPNRLCEAGRDPDAVPTWLRERGFCVTPVGGDAGDLDGLMELSRRQRKGRTWPLDLLAERRP